jgi:chromosome segregation ATPase
MMAKSTALTKRSEDPKIRMKEIRKFLRDYFKGKKTSLTHLGEYPHYMPDARRVVVALEDMVRHSQARHQKASLLVKMLRQDIQQIARDAADRIHDLEQIVHRKEAALAECRSERQVMINVGEEKERQLETLEEENYALHQKLKKRDEQLAAALLTIKTIQEED